MTAVIIRHVVSGERQVVLNLDGYDENEWEVLGIDREPLPNEEWDGQAWVLNEALAAEQEEVAEVTDRQRLRQALRAARAKILALETSLAQTRQQANQKIAAIEARLDALEAR